MAAGTFPMRLSPRRIASTLSSAKTASPPGRPIETPVHTTRTGSAAAVVTTVAVGAAVGWMAGGRSADRKASQDADRRPCTDGNRALANASGSSPARPLRAADSRKPLTAAPASTGVLTSSGCSAWSSATPRGCCATAGWLRSYTAFMRPSRLAK